MSLRPRCSRPTSSGSVPDTPDSDDAPAEMIQPWRPRSPRSFASWLMPSLRTWRKGHLALIDPADSFDAFRAWLTEAAAGGEPNALWALAAIERAEADSTLTL